MSGRRSLGCRGESFAGGWFQGDQLARGIPSVAESRFAEYCYPDEPSGAGGDLEEFREKRGCKKAKSTKTSFLYLGVFFLVSVSGVSSYLTSENEISWEIAVQSLLGGFAGT